MQKEDVKKLFVKVCKNKYPALDTRREGPALYRRHDLYEWAKDAYNKGQKFFYCEPVDPNDKYGELRLCEPKYTYELDRGLTEEEFNTLFDENKKTKI